MGNGFACLLIPPAWTCSSIRTRAFLPVSLLRLKRPWPAGISTCCPSPRVSRLGLGPDLPWDDDRCPGTLRAFGGRDSPLLSLLIGILFLPVHLSFRSGFPMAGTLPYPPTMRALPKLRFQITLARTSSAQSSRPVSYYALFLRWSLSEPTSWLFSAPTSFAT